MALWHITTHALWDAAKVAGHYVPASLASEGFIHLSTDRQWLTTAERFFHGQRGLVLLGIREDKLQAPLKYEAADGDSFPHLYGTLNLDAVIEVLDLPCESDGTFQVPASLRPWSAYFTPGQK